MIRGRVDRIDNHKIRGWCFDPSKPKERLTVELFIDGIKIKEGKANILRACLEKRKNTPGNCGFEISLPQSMKYNGQAIEILSDKTPIKSRFSVLLGEKKTERIERVQIYGERASGTNFLRQLLVKNIPNIAYTDQYGWKHFFPPETFPNSHNCLFIVIYRNPFDWLRSLHLQPHHTHQSLRKIPFSDFIRTEWHCIWDELANIKPRDEKYGREMMFERNPETGERFENVIKLRNAKIKAFESLRRKVNNIEYVCYEKLTTDPESFVNMLCEKYGLYPKEPFKNINTYKGITKKTFKPKTYRKIKNEDIKFILGNINISLEKKIGYSSFFTEDTISRLTSRYDNAKHYLKGLFVKSDKAR